MIFKDKIETFLHTRAGLDPSDIGYALTTIVTVKYLTVLTFVAGGVRFRPLNRIFRNVGDRTKTAFNKSLAKNVKSNTLYATMGRAVATSKKGFQDMSKRQHPNNVITHKVSMPNTSFEWAGLKYRKYSDQLSEKVSANKTFVKISKMLGYDPRSFAVGFTEGLILYKATVLVHFPLELYIIVKYFQWRRRKNLGLETKAGTVKNGVKLIRRETVNIKDLVTLGGMVYDNEYDGKEPGIEGGGKEAREVKNDLEQVPT